MPVLKLMCVVTCKLYVLKVMSVHLLNLSKVRSRISAHSSFTRRLKKRNMIFINLN